MFIECELFERCDIAMRGSVRSHYGKWNRVRSLRTGSVVRKRESLLWLKWTKNWERMRKQS